MSATICSYLILGARVTKLDFFDDLGQENSCSKCGKKRKSLFCPVCGGEVKPSTVWKAKPKFTEYATREEDTIPAKLWLAWWHDRYDKEDEPGLCVINALQPLWQPEDEKLALGIIISKCNDLSRGYDELEIVDVDSLPVQKILDVMDEIGIPLDRKIELFHCLYYS